MRLTLHRRAGDSAGYAMLLVLSFTGIGLTALAGVLLWSSNHANLAARNNHYFRNLAAAEGATEKALARINTDFQTNGVSTVDANLNAYRGLAPRPTESPLWNIFDVVAPDSGSPGLEVNRVASWSFGELRTKYRGLRGYGATYRVGAQVAERDPKERVPAVVYQDLQVAAVPLCEFGVFYNVDMEVGVANARPFEIKGRVHSNGSIHFRNAGPVVVRDHLTAAQSIVLESGTYYSSVSFAAEHDEGVKTFALPTGGPNTPEALRGLLDPPPAGESADSALGRLRFFNRADLVIRVDDSAVTATSGPYNGFAVNIPWGTLQLFVDTNQSFFNKRESKTVRVVDIDVNGLNQVYSTLQSALGREARVFYVEDRRSFSSLEQTGVRLVRGQVLPPKGLTLVTLSPLYIAGHFNVDPTQVGTVNTSKSLPALLVADAVTVLSQGWNDALSGDPLSGRIGTDTTVNAAVITGIVPTSGGNYSGGLENVLRLLEYWRNSTLTFNGSLAVLFHSQVATSPWGTYDVYSPPIRAFSFDTGFFDPGRIPAATPEVRTVFRNRWQVTASSTGG